MNYEYDFHDIGLTEDQRRLVDLGMVKVEDISARIKEIVNERAKQGWEPLYPFTVPLLWFRRIPPTQKRKIR
jgi:hypothetical protein